jgi:hypothetical protein
MAAALGGHGGQSRERQRATRTPPARAGLNQSPSGSEDPQQPTPQIRTRSADELLKVTFRMKRHANRKATHEEMEYATSVIREAFPEYDVVWGCHSDYGGHRAPRDHTLAFRLRDRRGKYHTNVIWVAPEGLASITVEWVKKMVARGTSHKVRSKLG